jgi:hypothetical protein
LKLEERGISSVAYGRHFAGNSGLRKEGLILSWIEKERGYGDNFGCLKDFVTMSGPACIYALLVVAQRAAPGEYATSQDVYPRSIL